MPVLVGNFTPEAAEGAQTGNVGKLKRWSQGGGKGTPGES